MQQQPRARPAPPKQPPARPAAAARAGTRASFAGTRVSASSVQAPAAANADEVRELRAQTRSDARVGTLNALVDGFETFNAGLRADDWAEREAGEARLQGVEATLERLHRNLATEVEARIDVVACVATSLSAQCDALDGNQAARLADARARVEVGLALLDNRIEAAHVVFARDQIATTRAIERAHAALLKTLLELRDALGVEIATRIEREARTAAAVSDQVFALQQLPQGEAGAFQATLGHNRDEQEAARAMLARSDDAFKHSLMSQLTACQRALRAECEERLAVEKQFVANLQDYAGGLIDGLRNVNRQVREDGAIR
jgi:hypothetical protein